MVKVVLVVALASFLSLAGVKCDGPTKPAGPGGQRQQPYAPANGQYR